MIDKRYFGDGLGLNIPDYPKVLNNSSIIQYDENVFVWVDETGSVGGVASTLEQAEAEIKAYADAMDPILPRPHDLPYVTNLLNESAALFRERNAVYKDNFRVVGRIMFAMFGENPPELKTEADYNRWHLFELFVVKLSRYSINYRAGGHADSLDDMIVYLAMVAALDAENGHRR